ncbi:hypothetical protein BaRGS_00019415 [Batillaria attramentaria]|uniref:Uncharacterized protein n=1 Tax=Batillaria attramentaria TaxID=370345 RepID=A0ABD0KQ53_9CAEN
MQDNKVDLAKTTSCVRLQQQKTEDQVCLAMLTSEARDSMHVYVDDVDTECTAYITDEGFDLDLLFGIEDHRFHIYSDVEGNEMTNYLFIDDACVTQQKVKNCVSKHRASKS